MIKYCVSALALCAVSSSASAAVSVSSTPYGLAAPAHTDVLVDFDSTLPKGFTLTGGLVQNVSNSQGAEPAGDASFYLSANPGQSASLLSDAGYRQVSLYWGSIDAYNTITLLGKNGTAIESFTGSQIAAPANGDQGATATNRRVTFTTSGATSAIYGLVFQSSTPAFEADNVAFSEPLRDTKPIGAVPEPSTWTTMIGGLGLLGASLRRSKKQGSGQMIAA